jgi:hypothetical protein
VAVSFRWISTRLMRALRAAVPVLTETVTIPLNPRRTLAKTWPKTSMSCTKAEFLLSVGKANSPTEITNEIGVLFGLLRYATYLRRGPSFKLVDVVRTSTRTRRL